MSIVDKAKGPAAQSIHKAGEVAGEVREKAGPLAGKAGDVAAKGVSAASAGANKVTGGRFEDKIGQVTEKVEGMVQHDKTASPGQRPDPPRRVSALLRQLRAVLPGRSCLTV
ncbi:antitoxin [Amycolatopsis sp. QT-25]|uniref:antitoxin n=1 Tax=Amycolatopsis sp. QT-25 TaxID=3034022 RepID=UPI0023EB511E|nr:antitoxin [Amycolatopsis sp. QT-25]WET78687.1 antitoxin [Amycolatopsis sp. QT-25]